ncbi:MAG: flavin reductase family protein [Thermanaerothrix sp.]|nr:flavin reductase family protein [Thermanaerothrix sp.]
MEGSDRVSLRLNRFFFPIMPVVLVGSMVEGRANFMAAAFTGQVNFSPPMFMVSMGDHATRDWIIRNRRFSICVPSRRLVSRVDLAGLVSARDKDKSGLFQVFFGGLPDVPYASECPINVGLSLHGSMELPGDLLIVGRVEEVLASKDVLSPDGLVDPSKVDPFFLSMPDNLYWSLGDTCGAAWHDGLPLKGELFPS